MMTRSDTAHGIIGNMLRVFRKSRIFVAYIYFVCEMGVWSAILEGSVRTLMFQIIIWTKEFVLFFERPSLDCFTLRVVEVCDLWVICVTYKITTLKNHQNVQATISLMATTSESPCPSAVTTWFNPVVWLPCSRQDRHGIIGHFGYNM